MEKKIIEIINIHPDITDVKLCKEMEEKDKLAKEQKDKELWVFFDEMNTCLSLSLLTEIFINRTYNGKRVSDNIRLIGACNPYRRRNRNISFGFIDKDNEKRYIHSIIEKLFSKNEKILHENIIKLISKCQKFLRKILILL